MFTPVRILTLGILCLTSLCAAKPNVLLICIDDLRPKLNCFGADYIHSPNIDKLAAQGRAFNHHYTNVPTCGASRYTLLTGRYGSTSNYARFHRAKNYRLVLHKNGTTELYDHRQSDAETINLEAPQPETVQQLSIQLKERVK